MSAKSPRVIARRGMGTSSSGCRTRAGRSGAVGAVGTEFVGTGGEFVLHGGDEAVSAAGEGFDVTGAGSGISQGFAHLVNGSVEAVVEVDEGVGGPELLLQLFARDDVSGMIEEQSEHLEGLALQAQLDATLAQFSRAEVELEDSETRDLAVDLGHDAVV